MAFVRTGSSLRLRFVQNARFLSTYYPNVDASKLSIEKTTQGKKKVPKEELKFGHTLSDHMLEIDWELGKGWTAPRIVPVHNLSISPAASCFQYATECFEGLKAYVDDSEQIRLFRPDMNMKRLNHSMKRLNFPAFDNDQLLECIKRLVAIEKSWIPRGVGYSLYLRPTSIGTWPGLGVGPSLTGKVYVLCSPVGPYYPQGFKPVKLLADTTYCRAWPGGTGGHKMSANYAPGILPALEAAKKGYSQILWLFGQEKQITEVGTMNIFFIWKTKKGQVELVTAPLDGTILPGVTRDSILTLAKESKEFDAVSEKHFTIYDAIDAAKENRLLEAFGAGTAAIVSPVEEFAFEGQTYKLPMGKENVGKFTSKFAKTIMDIQYGKAKHPWSIVVNE